MRIFTFVVLFRFSCVMSVSSCEDENVCDDTGHPEAMPIFMIPSMAGTFKKRFVRTKKSRDVRFKKKTNSTGTRLRTWSHHRCSPIVDFNIGGTVWLDVKRLLAARSCWIDCISLDPETQEDGVCLVRPDEGMDSISQVDESVPAGFLWKA